MTTDDPLMLVFEVTNRDNRHTTYTVHANAAPSGHLTMTNQAFDALLAGLDARTDPAIRFSAVHHHPEFGWPIRYADGVWLAVCDVHEDAGLVDGELWRVVELVEDHVWEAHR